MVLNFSRVLLQQTSYLKNLKINPVRSTHFLKLKTENQNQHVPSNVIKNNFIHTSTILNSTNFNVQDEDDFKERVLQSKVPIVADFHADWCGPCKLLGPRIEAEVDKHSGKILLAKVDIDDMPEIAIQYKINAVPSVILFKNGLEVDRFVGNLDDDLLAHFVNKETS